MMAGIGQFFMQRALTDVGIDKQHTLAGGGKQHGEVGGKEGFTAVRKERSEHHHFATRPVCFDIIQIGADDTERLRNGITAVFPCHNYTALLLFGRLLRDIAKNRHGATLLHFTLAVDIGIHHLQQEEYSNRYGKPQNNRDKENH